MSDFVFQNLTFSRYDSADLARMRELYPQLSQRHTPPTDLDVNAVIHDRNNHVWVCREPDRGTIVGYATITIVETLSDYSAIINDVVIDSAYRGHGLGRRLTEWLIRFARNNRVEKIILSSDPDKPERAAARALYQSLGFVPSTNGRWMILDL